MSTIKSLATKRKRSFFLKATLLLLLLFLSITISPPQNGFANTETSELTDILADGQFVYGPNVGSFKLNSFLGTQPSILKESSYQDVIQDQADYFSINPKVLLTIIEMQSGLVTNSQPSRKVIANPIGYSDESGFVTQVKRLAGHLYESFYWHLYDYQPNRAEIGDSLELTLADGSVISVSGELSAGTYALQAALAEVLDGSQWSDAVSLESPDGFYRTYLRLFPDDDPLYMSSVIGINAAPPSDLLKLPFTCNDTWKFYQGSHDWCGICGGAPNSSIDLGPSGTSCSNPPGDRWITAAASGTVTSVSCGGCFVRIDHGVNGWQTNYYHVTNTQVSVGESVNKDTPIGNPSCRPSIGGGCGSCGGSANAVHVHFGISQNGTYQSINGTSLEGWNVHETGCYAGYLQKGDTTVNEGGTVKSEACGGGCCGCALAVREPTNNQPQSEYSAWLASQLSPSGKRSPSDPLRAINQQLLMANAPSVPSAEIGQDREESAGVERTLPLSAPEVWCETHEASVWSSEPVVRLNLGREHSEEAHAGYAIVWDQMADTEPEAVVDPKELVDTSQTSSPELATGEWYAHVRAIDAAGKAGETVHLGPFLIDVTPPAPPTAIKSESHTVNVWSSEGAIDVGWAASAFSAQDEAAESRLAGYAYSWDQSPESEPEGHDLLPPNAIRLKELPLADGRWYFHLRALDQAGNASETVHLGPFLLDTTAPVLATSPLLLGGTEGGHVLTNDPQLDAFSWAPASDEGEVKGYYVYWGEEESGSSERFVTETSFTPEETIAAGTATTRYLRLAALDAAGNLSAWQTAATWHYDNVPPTGTLTIAGGGETVRSLNVTLNLAAEDADSALTQMRFSADGKEWSEWEAYTSRRFWQLQNQPQRQTLYAQVRDEAGNLSEPIYSSVVAELNVPVPASTNYQLARRAITMGGGQKTSNSYTVRGNSGQAHETGHLQSNNYQVKSGFWAGIGRVTPTPTPIPTITPTPTDTPTLIPTITPTPTDTPTSIPTITPTPTDTPTAIPTITPTPTTDPNSPNLSIPSQIPALPATSVAVPITFTSHGATISSVLFSVDFDESCLAFDPTDSDADGIPDAVSFNIPGAFQGGVSFDVNDSDGELDFSISDFFPPLAVLADSTLVTITLTATCQPQEQSVVASVSFSTDPSASFGDSSGQSVPGTTTDGSVQISAGLPGNCNGDQVVDAGDISALVLEVFDGDGNQPIDAPGGTFLGDPSGCNANQDALIDAGDISCTVLLIFNGSGACTTGQQRPDGTGSNRAQNAPKLSIGPKAPASDEERVTVPVDFTANDHQISTLVFSVDYEQNALSFDPTDSDGDGLPDAVTFNLPESFEGAVTFDPTDSQSELDFFIADLSLPLAELPEGPLAFITLEVVDSSNEGEINLSLHPATSFGNRSGQSVPGDGGSRDEKLYLPIILR